MTDPSPLSPGMQSLAQPDRPFSSPTLQPSRFLTAAAWIVLLLASTLPNILWQELTGGSSAGGFGPR
jgi:hypothetical protein